MSETVPNSSQIESSQIETPGLSQTRQLIQRFQNIQTQGGELNLGQINNFTKRFGTDLDQLTPDTYLEKGLTKNEKVVRSDMTSFFLDKLIGRGLVKLKFESADDWERRSVQSEVEEFQGQTTTQRLDQDLAELEEVLSLQKYVGQLVSQSEFPNGYAKLQGKIEQVVDIYKISTVDSLIKRANELVVEDGLGENVPHPKEVLDDKELASANNLIDAIKIVILASEPYKSLRDSYKEVIDPLMTSKADTIRTIYHSTPFIRGLPSMYSGRTSVNAIDSGSSRMATIIKDFSSNMRENTWNNIIITPEQTRKLYDVVAPSLLRDLWAGGYESWDGTHAAGIFYLLRDPRVLPDLVSQVRSAGSGHTTNIVISSIEKIAQDPLDKEELDKIIAGAPPIIAQIINNWFRDPNKVSYKITHEEIHGGLGGYVVADRIQHAEEYIGRGELLDLATQIANSRGQRLDRDLIKDFYYNNDRDKQAIEDLLLSNPNKVASIMAKNGVVDWRLSAPKLFMGLVSPRDGDFAKFPKLIASEGLSLGQEELNKIEKLYQSGDLKRGVMSRVAFAEGLLFLAGKSEGSAIAKDILDASTGANRDSERLRDIFGLLKTLDSFNNFGFTKRGSLAEIISDLKTKLVVTLAAKMELGEVEISALNENLFNLMRTGVFEIIPPLLAKFQSEEKHNVASVVREIGKHIVLGDFQNWRNNLETAKTQLAVLLEDKQTSWTNPVPEITIAMGVTKGNEARQGAVDAIKRIAEEARQHILEIYKLDFSDSGINVLKQKQQELTRVLKDSSKDPQEKRDTGEAKRGVDDQLRVIEGILGLENLSAENLDPVQLTKHIAGIVNSLNSFRGLDQAVNDLGQIAEVLTTQAEIGNVTKLRAYDSDDPLALLKVGIEPRETCQSYRKGSYNYCLPAYVADANKRLINVENDKGEILGRSVMKLTKIKLGNDQTYPAVLLEPIYTTSEIGPIYRGVVKIALEKAKAVGAYLILTSDMNVPTGANHEKTMPIVEFEAKKENMKYEKEDVSIYVPKSANAYEYSDSLGGAISYFDSYHNLSNTVVVKP